MNNASALMERPELQSTAVAPTPGTTVKKDGPFDLLNAAQMDRLIRREVMRADRSGSAFSLVLFEAPANRRARAKLERAILSRARVIDEAGWFDETHMCAFLPEAERSGARVFAQDVTTSLAPKQAAPAWRVYTYPDAMPEAGARIDCNDRANNESLRPLLVQRTPRWKRTLDIIGASVILALLSPVLAFTIAAIRLTSPGPIIFRQKRRGLGGKVFTIYKFRSMIVGADAQKKALRAQSEQDGPAFKMKHDPRITRIGRIIRKTSIDELPQLWNVIKGDMSLVGPRPLPVDESDGCQQWQMHRLQVAPGLTCIWQISGRSTVSFAQWVAMDLRYIRTRTLWHDLKILFQTVPAVLLRRGAR